MYLCHSITLLIFSTLVFCTYVCFLTKKHSHTYLLTYISLAVHTLTARQCHSAWVTLFISLIVYTNYCRLSCKATIRDSLLVVSLHAYWLLSAVLKLLTNFDKNLVKIPRGQKYGFFLTNGVAVNQCTPCFQTFQTAPGEWWLALHRMIPLLYSFFFARKAYTAHRQLIIWYCSVRLLLFAVQYKITAL